MRRSKKKELEAQQRAIAEAKALALQQFEEKYGEVHVNVLAVVNEKNVQPPNEEGQISGEAMLVNRVIRSVARPPMRVPEGGRVKVNVKVERKK